MRASFAKSPQFMQRSAGKTATPEPSTPNGPPSKKVRLSAGGSAPGTPNSPSGVATPQSADERRREEIEARNAERLGETKWVLSFQDPFPANRKPKMQVREAGFAVIDAEDDSEEEEEQRPIRMQFGGGVKKKPAVRRESRNGHISKCTDLNQTTTAATAKTEDSDSENESDSSDDFSSDDPTAALIRETKREMAPKERETGKSKQLANDTPYRPKTTSTLDGDMDLGGLSSLSGGGRATGNRSVECFKCGQKGHMKDQCTAKTAPRGSVGRGRGRGRGRDSRR